MLSTSNNAYMSYAPPQLPFRAPVVIRLENNLGDKRTLNESKHTLNETYNSTNKHSRPRRGDNPRVKNSGECR